MFTILLTVSLVIIDALDSNCRLK